MNIQTKGVYGQLSLTFDDVRGKTRIVDCYQMPPLKASRTLYPDGNDVATVYLVETAGGLVEGDKNEYSIHVKRNAKIRLIPQSATKIYPSFHQLMSRQEVTISQEQNTFLEWNREELIPFEEARFTGKTVVTMEKTACFLYAEIIYPGREKRGEVFAYESVSTHLEVWVENSCCIYDPLQLKPKQQSLPQIGVFDGLSYVGSIYVVAPSVHWTEEELERLLPLEVEQHVIGITRLKGHGFLIRWLSNHLPRVKKEMDNIMNSIRERVLA